MRNYIYMVLSLMIVSCMDDSNIDMQGGPLDEELQAVLKEAAPNGNLEDYILPDSDDFNAIPQDPLNPITAEKVQLGKLLFHETGIAENPKNEEGRGTFSCASCHHAQGGFQAERFQGIGDGGLGFGLGIARDKHNLYKEEDLDVQPIRTPSAMNIAYQINVLWNGQFGATGLNEGTEASWTTDTPKETNHLGFEGTETQAIAGLDVHRLVIDENLMATLGYKEMFDRVYANIPQSERYSAITAGLAIAAFERTILSNEAPFQKWLKGDVQALTTKQKEGAILFFDKGECASCHNGPSLANMEFHALGMLDLIDCPDPVFKTSLNNIENLGRGGFTGQAGDNYKFKVPQLYNLKDSPFYGHGSSFYSVLDVLIYKNEAQKENNRVPESALSPLFQPLNLSGQELEAITAFIESGLYDSNLERYVPAELPSGNCFPNADLLSQQELGCL